MLTDVGKRVAEAAHHWFFRSLHGHRLLYNACWEDPRVDRGLFGITPASCILVITSAGCNALDYLLDDPAEIVALDINPRQNALLELKLGVHQRQLALIEKEYAGGVAQYLTRKMRRVFTQLPVFENYFWRVYITGSYTPRCCPNYLKRENFAVLGQRLGRVRVVTAPLAEFLRLEPRPFTHFALLDHQDWLAGHDPEGLAQEWRALLARSRRGARLLLRSAGLALDYLPAWLGERLKFAPERTGPLHLLDRVGTRP
jgi:S-adenosylmethionine-diacylglycerol 3-amino-3-carboxypropyl transferase